jgi:hypothetical protein
MAVKGWRHRAPGAIIRENHHTETRTESIPQSVLERIAGLEKRELDLHKALQIILQAIEDQKRAVLEQGGRVGGIEDAMRNLAIAAEQQLKKAG